MGVGALLGSGKGPMSKWSRTPIVYTTVGIDGNLEIIFHISVFLHKNIDWGYSLESAQQGISSTEYPQYMFLWRIKENHPLTYGHKHWNEC